MEPWKIEPARDLSMPLGKRFKSERREGGLMDTVLQISARTLVRCSLKVWHRVEHIGTENLPDKGPFFMCANHSSHLDSVVMAAMLPWRLRKNTFPLAAGDVFFDTPIMSAFAATVINALPMWRKNVGRHALDDLRTRMIEQHSSYILFPEGRRSPDGNLVEFKAGLGMLIAGIPAPVVPCYIDGAFKAMNREQVFPRPAKITIRVGRPLHFADVPNTREGWKQIVHEVERSIRELGGLPPPADVARQGAKSEPETGPAPA